MDLNETDRQEEANAGTAQKNNAASEGGGGNDSGGQKKEEGVSAPETETTQPVVRQHQVDQPDVKALAERAEAKMAFEPNFEAVVEGSSYQKLALSDYSMALSQHAHSLDGEMTLLEIERNRLEAERVTLEKRVEVLQEKIDALKSEDELLDADKKTIKAYEAEIAGIQGQIQQIDSAIAGIAGIVSKLSARLNDVNTAREHAKSLGDQGASTFIKKPDGEIVAMKSAEATRLIDAERKAVEMRGQQPGKASSMAALMSMFNRNSAKAFAADDALRTGTVAKFNDLSIGGFSQRSEEIAQERALMQEAVTTMEMLEQAINNATSSEDLNNAIVQAVTKAKVVEGKLASSQSPEVKSISANIQNKVMEGVEISSVMQAGLAPNAIQARELISGMSEQSREALRDNAKAVAEKLFGNADEIKKDAAKSKSDELTPEEMEKRKKMLEELKETLKEGINKLGGLLKSAFSKVAPGQNENREMKGPGM